jgi:hypothetical protein
LSNYSEDLQKVAKRVVWFKSPDESLTDTKLFLAHLMTYGTLEDILVTMRYYTDADFERVLTDPPAGVFDLRSWNYWNLRYHHEPVPPLPIRVLPETNFDTL